jgi:ABC-type dipeptide/oligopeptide/nickel transport system permease component
MDLNIAALVICFYFSIFSSGTSASTANSAGDSSNHFVTILQIVFPIFTIIIFLYICIRIYCNDEDDDDDIV